MCERDWDAGPTGGLDGYFDFVSSSAEQASIGGFALGLDARVDDAVHGGSAAHNFALFVVDEIDQSSCFVWRAAERPGRIKALISGRVGGNVLIVGADDRLSRLFRRSESAGIGASIRRWSLRRFVPSSLRVCARRDAGCGFMTGTRPVSRDERGLMRDVLACCFRRENLWRVGVLGKRVCIGVFCGLRRA